MVEPKQNFSSFKLTRPPPPRGSRRINNGNNGAGDAAIMNGFHIYPGNPRKGNNQMNSHGGHALPAPLLSMAPPQPQLTNNVSSHSQSQSHSSSHSTSSMSNSASSTSHGNRNGHLHYSSLPPQSVPHGHSSEPYHRPYRGGDARYLIIVILNKATYVKSTCLNQIDYLIISYEGQEVVLGSEEGGRIERGKRKGLVMGTPHHLRLVLQIEDIRPHEELRPRRLLRSQLHKPWFRVIQLYRRMGRINLI